MKTLHVIGVMPDYMKIARDRRLQTLFSNTDKYWFIPAGGMALICRISSSIG